LADKTNKPQQEVLSVRISEALRKRLERAKQLVAAKTGEIVSTSEIAKEVLESRPRGPPGSRGPHGGADQSPS